MPNTPKNAKKGSILALTFEKVTEMHKFFSGVAQIAKCEARYIVEIRRVPAPQAPSVWKDPTRKIMEHSFYQRGVILNFQIYNWKLLIDGFLFLWYI